MVLGNGKRIFGKGFQLLLACFLVAGFMTISVAVQAADAPPAPAAQSAVTEAAAPAEATLPVGDSNTGKALFTGEKAFQNGGPACISCHSAGVGELGGGLLGPNLSKVYADPAKQALLNIAWVNSPGIPVMGPVFSAKNITEAEMVNLKAFFKTMSERELAPAPTNTFVIIGFIAFIGIMIFFSIIWSKRYSKRNQNTAHDALWRNYGGKGGR